MAARGALNDYFLHGGTFEAPKSSNNLKFSWKN